MIKLFRNIRKTLLEKGKTINYLKYAIGEIVLVVIGILIALQINNWNQDQKIAEERIHYMNLLKADLVADQKKIEQLLKLWEQKYEELKDFREKVNTTETKNALVYLARYEIPSFFTSFDGFNTNTYQSMINTGKLYILERNFRDAIQAHSKEQLNVSIQHQKMSDHYWEAIRTYARKYTTPADFIFIKNEKLQDIIWENANYPNLLQDLNSWGTNKSNYYRNAIRDFSQILNQTNKILKDYYNY